MVCARQLFHQKIRELYAGDHVGLGSVPFETGEFLYSFVRLTRPSLCVELGTYRGVSSLWIGQALEENESGELNSFDLFEHSDPARVGQLLTAFGLEHRVRVYRAASSTGAVEIMNRLERKIDFLFIDADHRIEAVGSDLMAFWPGIQIGGFALVHDTDASKSGWDGPEYILRMIRGARHPVHSFSFVDLPTPEGRGIAVVQKRDPATPKILPWPAYAAYQWRTRLRFWLKGGKMGSIRPSERSE